MSKSRRRKINGQYIRSDKQGIITFSSIWPNSPGIGKYYKKRFHKALRRAWKQGLLRRGERDEMYRGLRAAHSDLDYKGW